MSVTRRNRKPQQDDMATQATHAAPAVDVNTLKAFEEIVERQFENKFAKLHKAINNTNDKIDEALSKITRMQLTVTALETAAQDMDVRVETIETASLPALATHIASVTTNLATYVLDQDVHRRKWSLIIHGIKDAEREDELTTRQKCIALAAETLRVPNAVNTQLSACHRLSKKANAGIILRFVDLSQRNIWLTNARNLKNSKEHISISPDLPPLIRPLKMDLLQQRKELPPDVRVKSHVQYFSSWPYVKLNVPGQQPRVPTPTKNAVLGTLFGVSALLKL